VVVIVLLLQEFLQDDGQVYSLLIYAMNTAIVLDLLGLLGAYAAGSSREWDTSGYVIALAAAVLAFVAVHLVIWLVSDPSKRRKVGSSTPKVLTRSASYPAVVKFSATGRHFV
jgi:zinc transporter ZupT